MRVHLTSVHHIEHFSISISLSVFVCVPVLSDPPPWLWLIFTNDVNRPPIWGTLVCWGLLFSKPVDSVCGLNWFHWFPSMGKCVGRHWLLLLSRICLISLIPPGLSSVFCEENYHVPPLMSEEIWESKVEDRAASRYCFFYAALQSDGALVFIFPRSWILRMRACLPLCWLLSPGGLC